jgi:replicative DNA helicase
MFILRPEKYGILQDEEGESTKGITIVIFAKFRNGSQSDVVLKNNLSLTEFYDKDFMPELNSLPIPSESDFYINKNIETHKEDIPF